MIVFLNLLLIKYLMRMFKNLHFKLFLLVLIYIQSIKIVAQGDNPYKAPLYWNPYEYNIVHDGYIPESEWSANIEWMKNNLKQYGYNMICIDGWGDDSKYNQDGYRTTHSSLWTHDYAWWSQYLQSQGMVLGIYNNPLWVNMGAVNAGVKIKGTNIPLSNIVNTSENSTWFTWVQVNNAGAEEYVKGYIQYYADMGVKYLRVDFLSWFETGYDKGMNPTRVGVSRPHADYVKALKWMREACDANGIFLSLVMPHLANEAAEEKVYGHMYRINEDAGYDSNWGRFNSLDRGTRYPTWSQWHGAFDGYTYWSYLAGRRNAVLDGDFIRLNKFANDVERQTVISLHLMAGGPVSVSDQYNSIGNNLSFYQNTELLALNQDGFVGKPLFTNDPTNEASQVWAGQTSNGDWIVGLFNREDVTRNRSLSFTWLNITGNASNVRDLWLHQDLGAMSSVNYDVPAHGCKILRITPPNNVHQTAMYIGATFNSWSAGSLPMTLSNNVWTATGVSLPAGTQQLKFANTGNWTGKDWGASSGFVGKLTETTGGGANITVSVPANCTASITFNDLTKEYAIIPNYPVSSISLSSTGLSLSVGSYQQLVCTVLPLVASNPKINWTSSNSSIATVSACGLVTSIAAGTATITASSVDGGKVASCVVTSTVPVAGVTVSPTSLQLYTGGQQQLTASISPANASNQNISWSSSNTSVASVNSTGLVTVAGVGAATISVTTQDGSKTANCNLTVSEAIYVGGTFNSWSTTQMALSAGVYQVSNVSISAGSQALKFANTNNWTGADWGNATGLSGTASLSTGGLPNLSFTTFSSGLYTISFNRSSLAYSIVKQSNLPSPWLNADLGTVGALGSSNYNTGTFTIDGAGADIEGTVDAFQFAYQSFTGDMDIKAKVVSQTNTNAWAKAGVMIRESLAANAKNCMTAITPSNGICFQYRSTTGGATSSSVSSGNTAPYWIRIKRVGNVFSSYKSTDGSTWVQIGSSVTVSMNTTVYIGLAVSSHTTTTPGTAVFSNVSFNGVLKSAELSEANESVSSEQQLRVYPNPLTADQLAVEYTGAIEGDVRLSIKNSLGQEVEQIKITAPITYIPRSFFQSGLYFIMLQSDSMKLVRKLIVR